MEIQKSLFWLTVGFMLGMSFLALINLVIIL